MLPDGGSLPDLLGIAAVSAVLANLVNNLPAILILAPLAALAGHGPVLAALVGVNVGPSLTYVGSLATLLWRRIVHQGWTDALRAFHPSEEKLYTFWDYTAGCWQRDLGFRLDHLLCSPEAADRLEDSGVDRWARGEEKASDHAPTWVELS